MLRFSIETCSDIYSTLRNLHCMIFIFSSDLSLVSYLAYLWSPTLKQYAWNVIALNMCPSEAASQSMFSVASFIHNVCPYRNPKDTVAVENVIFLVHIFYFIFQSTCSNGNSQPTLFYVLLNCWLIQINIWLKTQLRWEKITQK